MDASNYQKLAARTECDQTSARDRMQGLPPFGSKYMLPRELAKPIRLNHAIIGAMGELGELATALEKWIYYGQELDAQNVFEELGDVFWYLALACNAMGFDMGKVMVGNLRKLQARFPEKYSDEKAAEEGRDRVKEAEALLDQAEYGTN